ncbi:MAG: glutamine synthetase type III, partial [Bacteroidota bacterium]
VDHNLLIMDLMRRVAVKHKFRVLHHEKPFKDINGSGKHNNWSLATDTGVNLLSPGKNPKSNLQFLTFLVNTIKAVYNHADLLRASIATAGNALRLGANEAPPNIMSVFIGSQLTDMLEEIEQKVTTRKMTPDEKTELKLNIGKIPQILLDNTDRNRTSPFAFTGNKFEFRAVGASANCAAPMIVLNTAVAEQLIQFKKDVESIINKGVKKDEAIFQVLRRYIIDSKPIRFEGNSYGEEWIKEAKKRGLSKIDSVPEAFAAYLSDKSIKLYDRMGVLTERELKARNMVLLDRYTKQIQIASRVLGDLALNHIVPTGIRSMTELLNNVNLIKTVYSAAEFKELAGARLELIKTISGHITSIKVKVNEMVEARKKANKLDDPQSKAHTYSAKVLPFLDDIRYHIDKLELIVDDEIWPLPKYRELLFGR